MAANKVINNALLKNAWPHGTSSKKSQYPTGKAYGTFKNLLNIAFPNHSQWKNVQVGKGAGAAIFVATIIRATGIDSQFPRTLSKQQEYFKGTEWKDKFTKMKNSQAQAGDLQISNKNVRLIAVPNIISTTKDTYVAQASYKHKYYGQILKKTNVKSGDYTTYRAKTSESSKIDIHETLVEKDRGYITQSKKIFQEIQDYAQKEKITNLAVAVSGVLNKLTSNVDYDDLVKNYYDIVINECKRALLQITTTDQNQMDYLLNQLDELLANNADEAIIEAQSARIDALADNLKDTSQMESFLYQLRLRKLALQMQKEHEEDRDSHFFTEVFLKDQTEEGGIQYEIINKYNQLDKEYKLSLNASYEQLNYLVDEKYTKKFNQYNQNLNQVNVKINDLKDAIRAKSKDYFTVQDEIDKINDDIVAIQDRISLFEKENFSDEYAYWNKNVILNPNVLNFWLEFLDTTGELSQFNIGLIGDRPKTINDTNATSIYFREIPHLIYIAPDETHDSSSFTGYTTVNIDSGLNNLFTLSAQKKSVKDVIDENLYNYAYCAEEINVTAIPIYYLNPGIITSIYDKNSNINGNYVINTISLPLTYNGNMTLTASKMPSRIL